MSTSSPVTLRTTSGPVTKMRPAGPMITMSVSAGPYAAPPAAGPSTTEICGTLPDARVIAANTRPTPSRLSTPSRNRAPPECHKPTIGTPSSSARSYAVTIAVQPAMPIAPPWIVGSHANATAAVPSIRPTPTSTPLSSSAVIVSRVPSSNNAVSRARGERGSSAVSSGEVVVTGCPFLEGCGVRPAG